jgi:hypothetical protein
MYTGPSILPALVAARAESEPDRRSSASRTMS